MRKSALTFAERFWSKVDRTDVNGCWTWNAATRGGYGTVKTPGGIRNAHRVSYEMHSGPIPPDMCVCHACDNPACVNPAHLFLGSKQANAIDAARKGRLASVRRAPRATPTIKAEIIARWLAGETPTQIAASMGRSRHGVSQLISRHKQRVGAWSKS